MRRQAPQPYQRLEKMMSDGTQIRPYAQTDADAWRAYVQAHPLATVFHRMAWSKAVAQAYGHRPVHLTAWSGDRLVGVLPLFLVKSVFVGRVLVSVPYATYGGILADSDEIAEAILKAAQDSCEEAGAEYLELRHREANSLDLPEIGRYDTFRKQLPNRPEEVLPSLPRKTRAASRKGLEALGPDAVIVGPELLDTVYELYTHSMRRLGSPNYRKRFFQALQGAYGDDCICLVVRDSGTPVSGVLSLVFRDEIVPYVSGSLEEGLAKFANNVMYLRLMEYAAGRGLPWFDFNRSRRDNRGPHAFKRYHGFEPAPLHYQIHLSNGGSIPNLTPSNRKFALAGRVWRKMPLWVTRPAGARITKWIP